MLLKSLFKRSRNMAELLLISPKTRCGVLLFCNCLKQFSHLSIKSLKSECKSATFLFSATVLLQLFKTFRSDDLDQGFERSFSSGFDFEKLKYDRKMALIPYNDWLLKFHI